MVFIKRIMKDVLFGVLIIILVTILEFIVTIPFGEPLDQIDRETWANLINRELLVTALPACLTTFVFTGWLKTERKADAIRRGIIWTSVMAFYYILIGLGNNNLGLIFGKIGVYVLLACTFGGTVLYAKGKKLS